LCRERFSPVTVFAGTIAFGWCSAAFGQSATPTPPASPEANQIEQVVVNGRLEEDLPAQLAQQGTRVDIVTAVDIKNAGDIDVAQSLETTVPGLYISPKNGPFDYVQVSLQGSRTEDVLWLVDGVRVNNRLYGGTTPLDTLPSGMIERIEVLEGTQALFYGTESIAGAINVITKDFSDTPNGALTVGAGSFDSIHFDGFFRDTLEGNHFVVYGSSDQSQGFRAFPIQDYQPSATARNRAYNMLTIGGKDAYDFTSDLRLTVSEQHNQGRLDYARPDLVATAHNDRNEDILSAKIDYTPSNTLQIFVKSYYHWWYSHYTEFDNVPLNPGAIMTAENNGFWGFTDRGVNAMAKFEPTPSIDYYLGYDFQNYSGRDAVLLITQHSESVNAVFGEIATTQALIPDVKLAAGFRYNAPSFGQTATVWNANARWDVSGELYVKGMVGTAFRLPTAEELFANDPNDERGDPNLKPETSTNANISVGGSFLGLRGLHWEAIGFYRDVTNLIDFQSFDAVTNQDVFGNVPGTVRVRGGELVLDASVTDEISGNFSYTYSSATEGNNQQAAQIPLSLAKASIDYHPKNWPFGVLVSFNYVGDIYQNVAGLTHVPYGNYLVVNASGRYFFDTERHHRVDITVKNVFDKQYASSLTQGISDTTGDAYPVPNLGQPRTVLVRYTYNF
jgi:outer membrane cobalamin receptor